MRSLQELLWLPREARVNGWRARERLRVEIAELAADVQGRIQTRLNALQARCGCLAAGLTTVAVWTAGAFAAQGLRGYVTLFFLGLGAGLSAKFAALAVTRWQFSARCRRLYREVRCLDE